MRTVSTKKHSAVSPASMVRETPLESMPGNHWSLEPVCLRFWHTIDGVSVSGIQLVVPLQTPSLEGHRTSTSFHLVV